VPAARIKADDEHALDGLAKYLPSVGLLIGLSLCVMQRVLSSVHANGLLAAGLIIFSWLWLTGGLHMDGFMDTADGVFSHRSRERMLEIMQDSRVGNFAVLAAISALSLKVFGLATGAAQAPAYAMLLTIPAWARACEVYAIGRFDYARQMGKGKVWHDTTRFPRDLILAILPVILISAAACFIDLKTTLIAVSATITAGVISAHWLNNQLGGHTGDTYGAVIEMAEFCGVTTAALFL
jgi:adenosylcobinamide-GDP ribazoletransferase